MGAPKTDAEKERRLVKVVGALRLQVNELTSLGAYDQANELLSVLVSLRKYTQGFKLSRK